MFQFSILTYTLATQQKKAKSYATRGRKQTNPHPPICVGAFNFTTYSSLFFLHVCDAKCHTNIFRVVEIFFWGKIVGQNMSQNLLQSNEKGL